MPFQLPLRQRPSDAPRVGHLRSASPLLPGIRGRLGAGGAGVSPAGRGPSWVPGLMLLVLVVAACSGDDPAPTPRTGELALPADEHPAPPYDGLLEREELRELVDWQQARDGALLRESLTDPDPLVRERGALGLASVEDPGSVPALLEALEDPEEGVRAAAALALGRTGGEGVAGALLEVLARPGGEPSRLVRARLMEAVGETGEGEAMTGLAEVQVPASDLEQWFLSLGRFANREVASPEGLRVLEEGLSLPAPHLRAAAAYYVTRHPDPGVWSSLVPRARELLESLLPWEPAGGRLLVGFANRGAPEEVPVILRWLRESGDWRIRVAAVQALAAAPASPLVPRALLEALDDPSEHVSLAAANALAGMERLDPTILEELASILDGEEFTHRLVEPLLIALIRGGQSAGALAWYDQLPEEAVDLRAGALRALAILPGMPPLERLSVAARASSPELARVAVTALSSRWEVEAEGDPAPPVEALYRDAFREAATRDDPQVRGNALRALTHPGFRSPETIELLEAGRETLDPVRDRRTHLAIQEVLAAAGSLPPGEDVLPPEPPRPGVAWGLLQTLGPSPRLVMETTRGRIVAVLAAAEAPLTVGAMAALANEGRYDDTPFHRVVPNFVVQGGDVARGDGSGGPGYRLRTELTRIPFLRGTLGMASSGKDTEGSQFFITHTPQPHLDGGYTAFGWVVEGMEVVDRLQLGDRIVSARVVAATP
jgi:cyclophilin family peptidyl-prolyl cis-trans isomerase/HEAT repeat protein